jgi:hypothetical protein
MSSAGRMLLAATIRRQIEGLNQLLKDAQEQGLSVYITDRQQVQVMQAYSLYSLHPNQITQGVTLYVHSITHTMREDL